MRRAAQEATLLITVVVLALVVWFVIADAENREIETRLGFSLQVDVIDLGSNLAVVGDPLPVSVTVVGREEDVESARPEHFKATVSLRNRSAGRHSLPVRVEAVEGDEGQVVEENPAFQTRCLEARGLREGGRAGAAAG